MDNSENMSDRESRVYDLAQSVIDAERRLKEIESGRIFRSIQFLKKSLANPLWGFKNIKQVHSLLRIIKADQLADSLPTAKEYLEDTGIARLPASLVDPSRYMKYPHIQVASIGDPGIFRNVAHTFMVDRTEWQARLDLGVDFLLITDHEKASTAYGKKTIEAFRDKSRFRALVDDCARILWWVTDKKQLDNPQIKDEDVIIIDDLNTSSQTHHKTVRMLPSIDPEVHSPINWLSTPETGLMVIGSQDRSNIAIDFAKKILPGFDESDFFAIDTARSDRYVSNAKGARAVLCQSSFFADESAFVVTALELIASGVPLITDGGNVLNEILGSQYSLQKTPFEAQTYFDKLEDPLFRERQSIQARQLVLREHSHLARFEKLLDALGFDRTPVEKISVIMSTMRQSMVEHGIESVASQVWPNKQLVLVLHRIRNADFDLEEINRIVGGLDFEVVILDRGRDTVFGDNLNMALDAASGEYVAKFDDDDHYGPNHLNDLHLAYHYSGAMAVGKWANFVYLTGGDVTVDFVTHYGERFGSHLPGATLFMKRHDLRQLRFGRVKCAIDSDLYRRAAMRGGRLYSTHRYNFVRVRHDDHTYDQDEEHYIAGATAKPRKGLDEKACFI